MKYYTWRQLPNFLLAFPMVLFSIFGIGSYICSNPSRFFSLGLIPDTRRHTSHSAYYSNGNMPFIVLWIFMLATCTLVMHIQVITRFFSALPPLYWYASHLILSRHSLTRAILGFSLAYGYIGTVLFACFYPPA